MLVFKAEKTPNLNRGRYLSKLNINNALGLGEQMICQRIGNTMWMLRKVKLIGTSKNMVV